MNSLKNVYEVTDSASSEDQEELLERVSTYVPRDPIPNYRVVLEISRSSAVAVADEEKHFDMSADSLELNCKRMRLDSNARRVDSELYPQQGDIVETQKDEGLPDRPESPNESLMSEVFVLKEYTANEESVTSTEF